MHAANGLDALEQVVSRLGIGVVQQALIAGALGTRLVGVDAGDDEQALADAVLQLGEACHVIEDGVLAIGRAGADDEHAAVILAAENGRDLGIEFALRLDEVGTKRHLLADLFGDGQQTLEFHGHDGPPLQR